MFDAWVKAEVIPDPDSTIRTADLWGAYWAWITIAGADYHYGKNRFVHLLEQRGLGEEIQGRRGRWYRGVRTVTPMV